MNIYIIDTELDTLAVHTVSENSMAIALARGLLHVAQVSKGLSVKDNMEEYFTSEGCFNFFRFENSPVYAIVK